MGEQVAAGFPWGISSVGRAPALQAGGHRFDPVCLHHAPGRLQKFDASCRMRNSCKRGPSVLRSIFKNLEMK